MFKLLLACGLLFAAARPLAVQTNTYVALETSFRLVVQSQAPDGLLQVRLTTKELLWTISQAQGNRFSSSARLLACSSA
jgi:hypothetical protein